MELKVLYRTCSSIYYNKFFYILKIEIAPPWFTASANLSLLLFSISIFIMMLSWVMHCHPWQLITMTWPLVCFLLLEIRCCTCILALDDTSTFLFTIQICPVYSLMIWGAFFETGQWIQVHREVQNFQHK